MSPKSPWSKSRRAAGVVWAKPHLGGDLAERIPIDQTDLIAGQSCFKKKKKVWSWQSWLAVFRKEELMYCAKSTVMEGWKQAQGTLYETNIKYL